MKECWKCIDELDPGETIILVDNDGRIMSMRSSDGTVLVPTTQLEMQRQCGSGGWGNRSLAQKVARAGNR